jgi:hypothetical protein
VNRSQQNKAIKDLQELVATIQDFEEDASHVILRDHFTSGQRLHLKGELGEMEGTPPPYTSDPTGEEACWSERSEDIGKTITKMATSINQWLTMAKWIRDLSAVDVVARAQRTVPDCLACGDPCLTRVVSGFDDKCYQRFVRAGRPDRTVFINATKASRVQKEAEEADA